MSAILTGREAHPVLKMLPETLETLLVDSAPEKIAEFYDVRRQAMAMEQGDPLRYGYEPPIWKVADFHRAELRRLTPAGVIHEVNLGGNRASKTERAAKRIMQYMVANPGALVWCCDSNEAQSRQNQQKLIWKYFPPEWKNEETGRLKRTATTKVNHTQAGGFTENTFVLPNGAQCWFKFYGMDIDDQEGPELDIVWGDELIPLDWIETLVYRLITRNGLMHVTFTPKKGYTPTVGHYLDGSRVVEEVDAPLLPRFDAHRKIIGYDKVPRIRFCDEAKARVIYFHTSDNPYGNYPAMVEEAKKKSRLEVEMRAYGHVTKAAHTQFPMFKDNVHVISMNRFAGILKAYPNGTRCHLVDPCSGRNWFMVWCYFPFPKKCIIYREWPSHGHAQAYIPGHGDIGPWALPSKGGKRFDGERGPGQDSIGFGLDRYKQEILRNETLSGGVESRHAVKEQSGITQDRLTDIDPVISGSSAPPAQNSQEIIYERWIDARYSNATKTEREGETTLIEQMEDIGMRFNAMDSEKNILGANDGSIDMINSALYYDQETELGKFSAEMARPNEPWLQVTENCPNVIFALKNWTAKDGQHGACKDPVDDVRGIFLSELGYVDVALLKPRVPWLARRR